MQEPVSAIQPEQLGVGVLFTRIREAVIVADLATGRVVLWNPSAERLFGYTAEEARGLPIETLIPPHLRSRHQEGFAYYQATGHGLLIDSASAVEFPAIRKDGQEISIEMTLSPLDDVPAEGRFVLAVIRDVSERKGAEALATGQQKMLELIARDTPLPDVLDALIRFIEAQASGMLCSVLLLAPDGTHLRQGAAPSLPAGYNARIDGMTIGPSAGSCGTAAYRKETVIVADIAQDPLWAQFRELAAEYHLGACWSTPILSMEGQVLGTFAMYYREPRLPTIEDRKLVTIAVYVAGIAIERQRTLENRFQLLQEKAKAEVERDRVQQVLNALPEAVIIVNVATRSVLRNPAAHTLLGPQASDTWSPGLDQDAALSSRARHLDGTPYAAPDLPIQRSLRTGAVIHGEQLLLRAADGQDTPVLVSTAPLFDATQRVVGAVGVFQNISALKELERQKDEFLGLISHDLKNPLTAISGTSQLLLRRARRLTGDDGRRFVQGLETIEQTVMQMTQQINELLDNTRLQMGRPLELRIRSVDLLALLTRLAAAYGQATERHSLRLETDLPALVCLCDEQRVQRVCANVLANALKYSPEGGPVLISIQAAGEESDGWATISITDSGIGIPSEELPLVFDRFYRASNARSAFGGTGLGLAGAQQIVEQHGGTIAIDSRQGAGTTVTIRLPLAGPPAGEEEAR